MKDTIAKAIPPQLSFINNQLSIEKLLPLCLFLTALLHSTAAFADTQNAKELPIEYGSAVVEKVNAVEVGYIFLCDVKDWPDVIGTNIRVKLDRLVPPAIVTQEGKPNSFFDLQTKNFINTALSKANTITLNNIKRAETFGIIAEVVVDSNSLAELLIENGLAGLCTDKETVKKKEQIRKTPGWTSFVTSRKTKKVKSRTQPGKESGWTASKNGKVFHSSDCSFNKRISPENLIKFDSRAHALRTGRRPCKTCKP